MAWTEEQVRSLLLRLGSSRVAARGWLLGAQIGAHLRLLDPEFHPRVLGDERLQELLERFPDIGLITRQPGEPDFVFEFGATVEQSGATVEQSDDSDEAPPRMRQDLWLALVAPRTSQKSWLDLESQQVHTHLLAPDGSLPPDSPVSAEPERFLEIAPIPQDDLREIAEELVEQQVTDETVKEELLTALEGDRWFPLFSRRARAAGLHSWPDLHRAKVVDHATAFLEGHGFRSGRFLLAPRRRQTSTRPWAGTERLSTHRGTSSPQPAGPRGDEELRQLVRGAVERMPAEELRELRIPLKYLFP